MSLAPSCFPRARTKLKISSVSHQVPLSLPSEPCLSSSAPYHCFAVPQQLVLLSFLFVPRVLSPSLPLFALIPCSPCSGPRFLSLPLWCHDLASSISRPSRSALLSSCLSPHLISSASFIPSHFFSDVSRAASPLNCLEREPGDGIQLGPVSCHPGLSEQKIMDSERRSTTPCDLHTS